MSEAEEKGRIAARDAFIAELGLQPLRTMRVDDTLIDRILICNWPRGDRKETGRRYDQTVHILIYDDESWEAMLSDGTIQIERSKKALQAMAIAAETASDQPGPTIERVREMLASFRYGRCSKVQFADNVVRLLDGEID